MKAYYKFEVETPFCGTEETFYFMFDGTSPTEKLLNEILENCIRDNAETYLFLLEDYDLNEEDYVEEEEEYFSDCSGYYEEITEEEYKKKHSIKILLKIS